MKPRRRTTLVIAAALAGLMALMPMTGAFDFLGSNGEPEPASAEDMQAEAPAEQMELMEIQQRVLGLEEEAMADEELQAAMQELDSSFEAAMKEADPDIDDKTDRLEALVDEIQAAAQADAGHEVIDPLMAEAQALEMEILDTQAEVVESEPLASEVAAFQEQLEAKMVNLDPEFPELVERAKELADEMQLES